METAHSDVFSAVGAPEHSLLKSNTNEIIYEETDGIVRNYKSELILVC